MAKGPDFLTLDEVLAIRAHQIRRCGGSPGLRDRVLLESALAMPRATFAGEKLHATVTEQAAASLFHLTKNHPFVDGNTGVGLACCLAFLRLNGRRVRATDDELARLVEDVAAGGATKSEVAVFLRSHLGRSASRSERARLSANSDRGERRRGRTAMVPGRRRRSTRSRRRTRSSGDDPRLSRGE